MSHYLIMVAAEQAARVCPSADAIRLLATLLRNAPIPEDGGKQTQNLDQSLSDQEPRQSV